MKKIAKMQNLLQNELNQIEEMCDKSQDELERIAKIRSKNYEEMSKEELIMSFLKSKQNIAELFNNNLNDDDKISDIRRILNGLRYMYYPKNIESKLKKSFMKQKIMKIFYKQKKKKMMNILENQSEFLIKKNMVITIVMILITVE